MSVTPAHLRSKADELKAGGDVIVVSLLNDAAAEIERLNGDFERGDEVMRDAITKAVREERAACLKIAEDRAAQPDTGGNAAAVGIANAIRSRT